MNASAGFPVWKFGHLRTSSSAFPPVSGRVPLPGGDHFVTLTLDIEYITRTEVLVRVYVLACLCVCVCILGRVFPPAVVVVSAAVSLSNYYYHY